MAKSKTRKHALLSASSASRWLACPPSAVAAATYEAQDTAYTKEGTLAHTVAETFVSNKVNLGVYVEGMNSVTGEMLDCASRYADYIESLKVSDDAVLLTEQKVDFSEWVPSGFGTCDCILIQGDTLTIIDYKYGVGVPVSAVNNPQMRLYALGALNDFGIAYDVTKIETHIFQPRLDSISVDRFTREELLVWAEDIVKPVALQAAAGKGSYNPGDHCRFCPHAGRCRKLTQVCSEVVRTHGIRARIEVLPAFEVAEVLSMEPLINIWLKSVKARALNDLLSGQEVPGYKVVEGKLGNRKWKDETAVAAALDAEGIAREDYTETRILSPAAMDKSLGKKKAAAILSDLIVREPGAPTVVPVTDKRPPLDRLAEAKEDFLDD